MKLQVKRYLVLAFTAIAFAILTILPLVGGHATALAGSDFRAGRIMDDGAFFNGANMTASQVSDFLVAKVPVCDTNGSQNSSHWNGSRFYTRAEWGAQNGNPAPYTCLKNYTEVVSSKAADAYCSGAVSGGLKTSFQMIVDASQACGVSPKVLIVLLQKEQSLVTDDWPWSIQYRSATGFGCPDTAACDSTYYGFFNQIYNAARQFQMYAKRSTIFNYRANQTSYVQYNPNTSCGGTNLYLENQTTAGLYNYTPYQPNASALNNLYGSGDNCGAYGNRNFWRLYSDWFGSPLTSNFYATPVAQSSYPSLSTGAQSTVYMNFKNWGVSKWYDSTVLNQAPAGTKPVNLSTSHNLNRASSFVHSEWVSSSRAATSFAAVYEADGTTLAANQHVAEPGQIAKYSFKLSVPGSMAPGIYREFFQPIVEGTGDGSFNDTWSFFDVTVLATPSMSWYDQDGYPTIAPGGKASTSMRFRNNGNVALYDDASIGQAPGGNFPVHLSTKSPLNRSSAFAGPGWASSSRPALNFSAIYESNGTSLASNQHVVQPGQIAKYTFNLSVPDAYAAGSFNEDFQPILEGSSNGGFTNVGALTTIAVPSTASVSYTVLPANVPFVANLPAQINFTIKNTGNLSLPGTTKIITPNAGAFKDNSWVDSSILVSSIGSALATGQTRSFSITALAPDFQSDAVTPFTLSLQSSANVTIPLSTVSLDAVVSAASYKTSNISQAAYPAFTYGQTEPIYFMYKNIGNQYWYDSTSLGSAATRAPYAIHLATSDPINRNSIFTLGWPSANRPAINFAAVYEANGTTLASNQHIAQPGQIVKFSFQTTPSPLKMPGIYREFFQPIAEGATEGRFNKAWTFIDFNLLKPTYIAGNKQQSVYPQLHAGQQATVYFSYTNNGAAPWYDDTSITSAPGTAHPIHLATSHSINRVSRFVNSDWPSSSRPAVHFTSVYESNGTTLASNQHIAQPGQIVKFSYTLNVPLGTPLGIYREFFQPIAEGSSNGLFNDTWTFFDVTVN